MVDVYLGPQAEAKNVYIVHQRKAGDWERYDEDKCMIGFGSLTEAKQAYLQQYGDKRFLGPVTTVDIDTFKRWLKDSSRRGKRLSKGATDLLVPFVTETAAWTPGGSAQVVLLSKAVQGHIPTPMHTDKEGNRKVSYHKVPVGASIWVTVTDSASPLHGRHIMLTKRPDHQMAITGGAGFKYWNKKADPSEGKGGAKDVESRRHLAVPTGETKTSEKDIKGEEERVQAAKENEPKKAALKEIRKEVRAKGKELKEQYMGAFGVSNPTATPAERAQHKETAYQHALSQGADEEKARAYANTVARVMSRTEREHRERVASQRAVRTDALVRKLKTKGEGGEFRLEGEAEEAQDARALADSAGVGDSHPDPVVPQADSVDMTPEEYGESQGHAVADQIDVRLPDVPEGDFDEDAAFGVQRKLEDGYLDAHDQARRAESEPEAPSGHLRVGESIEEDPHAGPEAMDPKNVEQAEAALGTFQALQDHQAKAREVEKTIRKAPGLKLSSPAALEQLRLKASDVLAGEGQELSPAELTEKLEEHAEQFGAPPDDALYRALGEHWNDEVGNTVSTHASDGAASAITALIGEQIGARLDVQRITDVLGGETAAIAIAHYLRDEMPASQYDRLADAVKEKTAATQRTVEARAMKQHGELKRQQALIEKQESEGLLRGDTAALQMAHVITEQRRNLGTALGSLSASAAMSHFLDQAKRGGSPSIDINVGKHDLSLQDKLDRLGRRVGRQLSTSKDENGNHVIHTTTRALRALVGKTVQDKQRNAEWEGIKTSTEGVKVDAQGNHVVPGYSTPAMKEGVTLRVEQRNDLEWLKRSGGGMISRVTGAGKTLTALLHHGNLISQDPNHKGIIVVPKGRVGQWAGEAGKFTDLNVVEVPEGIKREQREAMYAQAQPGQVFITSHRDAGTFDHEAIAAAGFNSMTIDEPQELRSRTSDKMSVGARRLMAMPTENRLALTATPAREHATEAYNLVHWAAQTPENKKPLGDRTKFARAYGGFGSGTNAQDNALQRMLAQEIAPYVSGSRITKLPFDIKHESRQVSMTPSQQAQQKEIEQGAEKFISDFVDSTPPEKRAKSRTWVADARKKAINMIQEQHWDNLHGVPEGAAPDHNAKVSSFIERVKQADPSEKHVVYVDSKAQRQAVVAALRGAGYKSNQYKNITAQSGSAGAIGKKKQAWQEDPNVPFILIDKTSASGHNLQQGSSLHVLGSPEDAANYLQAQGRVARMPREGDVNIVTYRHDDSPFENKRQNVLDSQMKVLGATAPGLFAE